MSRRLENEAFIENIQCFQVRYQRKIIKNDHFQHYESNLLYNILLSISVFLQAK